MKRDLAQLADNEFDLIVVGGGIFGCCAAWEAASRGLRVALLEQGDFSHASSANHLKMVHGGIRYIQHGDLARVRESARERSAFLRIAPHLVEPFPIVMPTYGHGLKGKEILRAGMAAYDLVTLDRNRGIRDPRRRVPRARSMGVQEVLGIVPGLDRNRLTGAAVFYDGQIHSPPRLAVSFLRSAASEGASAANYARVVRYLRRGNRVVGVEAEDGWTGGRFEVRGRTVLNMVGGWTQSLLQQALGAGLKSAPAFSRDLAFVVRRKLVNGYGFACPLKTKDADALFDRGGRHLFVAPWRDHTLVGVWHGIWGRRPEDVSTTEEELEGYLAEVNEAHPSFGLSLDDVSVILTGLTLFGDVGSQGEGQLSFGKRSRLVDHESEHEVSGLVTLIGVRATTARGKAEQAIDLILQKLGRSGPPSGTASAPIFGGAIDDFEALFRSAAAGAPQWLGGDALRALLRNYGSEYRRVLRYAEEEPELQGTLDGSTVLKAEVRHAAREEMAQTLADVVFRRTDLGTRGDPGGAAVRACAELAAAELAWDSSRLAREVREVTETFRRRGFVGGNPEGGTISRGGPAQPAGRQR